MTKLLNILAFAVSACAMLALAQPASAADDMKNTTAAAAATASVSAATGKPRAARSQHYCMNVFLTGSRIARRICKTKAEWADEGVDLDKK